MSLKDNVLELCQGACSALPWNFTNRSEVTTHAPSSLLFKRNNEARLLPLYPDSLAFAYSTPVDLIAYCSRIGLMPAYTTISNSLDGLPRV
jgi:hypothetical protein